MKKKSKIIQYAVVGGIASATIAAAAVDAILKPVVGYVAIYFFAPLWKKIAKRWEKKQNE